MLQDYLGVVLWLDRFKLLVRNFHRNLWGDGYVHTGGIFSLVARKTHLSTQNWNNGIRWANIIQHWSADGNNHWSFVVLSDECKLVLIYFLLWIEDAAASLLWQLGSGWWESQPAFSHWPHGWKFAGVGIVIFTDQQHPFVLYQDNAPCHPCHRAMAVETWFENNDRRKMLFPSQAADVNHTKYIWRCACCMRGHTNHMWIN